MDSRKFQIVMRLIDVVERSLVTSPDEQPGTDMRPTPEPPQQRVPENPFAHETVDQALTQAFNKILGDNATTPFDGVVGDLSAEPPPTRHRDGGDAIARGNAPAPAIESDFADDEVS